MIKTVIFDLDNTLIRWKSEYIFVLEDILKKYKYEYSKQQIHSIDDAINNYENENVVLTPQKLLDYVNKTCNTNLKIEVIEDLIKGQGICCSKYSDKSKKLLEYLSSKYELGVISNWFTETQVARLKNAGILEYFNFVEGGEKHEMKPSVKAFSSIKNPCECVMIGDSIAKDIEPALKLGMKAILITNKKVKRDSRYEKIRRLEDLREIL